MTVPAAPPVPPLGGLDSMSRPHVLIDERERAFDEQEKAEIVGRLQDMRPQTIVWLSNDRQHAETMLALARTTGRRAQLTIAMTPDDFNALPDKQRQSIAASIAAGRTGVVAYGEDPERALAAELSAPRARSRTEAAIER